MQCYWSMLFILGRLPGESWLDSLLNSPLHKKQVFWEAWWRLREGEEEGAEEDLLGHWGFVIVHKADEDRGGAFTNSPWPGIKIKGLLSLATSGWCRTLIQVQRQVWLGREVVFEFLENISTTLFMWAHMFSSGENGRSFHHTKGSARNHLALLSFPGAWLLLYSLAESSLPGLHVTLFFLF